MYQSLTARIACLLLRINVRREKISLDSYCMDVPMLVFAAWFVQELVRVSFRTYCGCLRTSLRTKTVSSPNFSPNLHCSHMNGNCYDEPQIAVGYFKRYFKYTLYIAIKVNIVLYSSKDWSFNQNLAYLWSFLSISAFVSINFCIFAVKQLIIYHGKVKSYKSRSSRT